MKGALHGRLAAEARACRRPLLLAGLSALVAGASAVLLLGVSAAIAGAALWIANAVSARAGLRP